MKKCNLFAIFLFFTQLLSAQPGGVNPYFNSYYRERFGNGFGFSGLSESTDHVCLSDGKMYVSGGSFEYNGYPSFGIIRLNSDGSKDPTFNSRFADGFGRVNTIVVQSDGKVILAGDFLQYDGAAHKNIVRINSDGSLDPTFQQPGWGIQGEVKDMVIQSSGKVVAIGQFDAFNNQPRHGIVRLNLNGSLDTSFGLTTGSTNIDGTGFECLAIQSDDRLMLGGYFTDYCGQGGQKLMRLTADGLPDYSFSNAGIMGWESTVDVITVANDGKIIVGGYFTGYGSNTAQNCFRTQSDGTIDSTFIPNFPPEYNINFIGETPNGKLILGGYFFNQPATDELVLCLENDGSRSIDFETFIDPDTQTLDGIFDIAILPDNSLILLGNFLKVSSIYKGHIAKISETGELDMDYAPGVSAMPMGGYVNEVEPYFGNRIIFAGAFNEYNNTSCTEVARIFEDGTFDSSFVLTDTIAIELVTDIAVQPDGKILLSGDMLNTVNNAHLSLIRLNSEGSIDTTFQPGQFEPDGMINAISIQPDAKILLAGAFDGYNGVTHHRITRITSNGENDPDFYPNLSINNEAIVDIELHNNMIYLLGYQDHVYRLYDFGPKDNSFANFNFAQNWTDPTILSDFLIKPDGKIVVAGWFNRYALDSSENIIQLDQNGLFDPSFNVPANISDFPFVGVAMQDDGKIISGNGDSLVRFNIDGSLDMTFNTGTGFLNDIVSDFIIVNNALVVVGHFLKYNETFQNHIVAINLTNSLETPAQAEIAEDNFILYPNPSNDIITISSKKDLLNEKLFITDLGGKILYSIEPNGQSIQLDISNLSKGCYLILSSDRRLAGRIFKQ